MILSLAARPRRAHRARSLVRGPRRDAATIASRAPSDRRSIRATNRREPHRDVTARGGSDRRHLSTRDMPSDDAADEDARANAPAVRAASDAPTVDANADGDATKRAMMLLALRIGRRGRGRRRARERESEGRGRGRGRRDGRDRASQGEDEARQGEGGGEEVDKGW